MRLSTKVRYAVQAMVDLALQERSGPVSLAVISSRQGVSLSFMEQQFARLRRSGLVESTRGPGGGYTLARPADAISVGEIVDAVDDPPPSGGRGEIPLWSELDRVVSDHLHGVRLKTLVEGRIAAGDVPPRRTSRSAVRPPAAREPARAMAPNSVFAFGMSFAP